MKTGFRNKTISANFRQLAEHARYMREHPTEAERIMWYVLSANKFGVNFRRQHIIGEFVVDFACLAKSLVIEIDGGYHMNSEQHKEDEKRTEWLEKQGFTIIRFTNDEVLNNIDDVIRTIERYVNH